MRLTHFIIAALLAFIVANCDFILDDTLQNYVTLDEDSQSRGASGTELFGAFYITSNLFNDFCSQIELPALDQVNGCLNESIPGESPNVTYTCMYSTPMPNYNGVYGARPPFGR